MAYYKIGFHTGPGGNRNGIGEYWRALDAEGIPASLMSVDDYGPCYELEQLGKVSGVPHDIIFRFSVGIPGFNGDVPIYDLTPEEAAEIYGETIYMNLPPEFLAGNSRDRVRIGIFNECDKNRASWLGYCALYVAKKLNNEGIMVSAFGWSTGEPEYDDWEVPGMEAYLRYASKSNGMADVMSHEYSLTLDLQDGFGYLIGRFQFYEDACKRLGIEPPGYHITEFGWTYQQVPSPTEAIRQMEPIVALYNKFPWLKGAMIWYLGGGFGGIANQAQKLIAPVAWEALGMGYNPEEPPIEPPVEPPEDGMIDLAEYFIPTESRAHGPIYMLYNNWGQGPERCHLSRSPRLSPNHFYVSKNDRWERRYIDDNWVYLQADTSRADDEFYTIAGDPWMPRYMLPGQVYTRTEHTYIYALSNCGMLDQAVVTSDIKMIGQNQELTDEFGFDVIEFQWIVSGEIEEWQYYGKHVGLVRWKNRWGNESKLKEFVPDNEKPNRISWECSILDEWTPSPPLPPWEPPTPPEESLDQRGWKKTVEMQKTGNNGIRLNAAAGIQQEIARHNKLYNLSLQVVTTETEIDGHVYQAAESLTGACPRRVYHYFPGEVIRFFEDPSPGDENYLAWPVVNSRHGVNSVFGVPRSYGPHEGVDLYCELGDPIVACMGGKVVWASNQRRSGGESLYGNHVIIEHPNGWITWYAHLDSFVVEQGEEVSRFQVIGIGGSSGNSTGPHLHLNLQIPGAGLSGFVISDAVDPEPFLV